MSVLWIVFDILLVGGVVVLAWTALAAGDGFRMIVLFMVFGLLVALAWARLGAPDVALAEAAVGAGVTGALFLRTWKGLSAKARQRVDADAPLALRLCALALSATVTALLLAAFALIAQPVPGLAGLVGLNLADSGVSNPVTAVLLNFRAYDTLLELVVLLAAIVVVWLVGDATAARGGPALGPIFLGFARLAVPATIVISGYLLWIGAFAPGGAFQAGALLAATGIVLMLGRLYAPDARDRVWARLVFVLGVAGFLAAALLTLALGQRILEYPPDAAKNWILSIEAVLTISIAATLAGLFFGGRPVGKRNGNTA